jgi:nucleoside-diphosphate-sugar epimerase
VLDGLAGRIGRYVLISSGDVYRNYGGLTRHEDAVPEDWPLTEEAPRRRSRFPYRGATLRARSDPDHVLDDYDKIPIEATVAAQAAFDWTILRLPMTFGPGDRQRRFGWIIWRLHDGRTILPLDRRVAGWRGTHGFVDDVADGIALAACHPDAARQTFNLGMAETPTQAEWATRMARAMGREVRVVEVDPAPGAILRELADRLDTRFPLRLDTRRIRDRLGFAEIAPVEEALRRTLEDELARGRPAGLEEAYRAEDHLLQRPRAQMPCNRS